MDQSSKIQQFYNDKNVFITGATGFVGKLLVEKLLRSTDVAKIFVLIRTKKGKNINTRLDETFNDVVFDQLKTIQPNYKNRVEAIEGDICLKGLGLKLNDRQKLIQQTNIIFHVAATINFNENLKQAFDINVKSVMEILVMAKEMQQLNSFIYCSTAYSNSHTSSVIEEKIYEDHRNVEEIEILLNKMSKQQAEDNRDKLIGKFINTYTFTKALAETYIEKNGNGVPVGIFRPAIVISTYKEPVPGWLDNFAGPIGALAAGYAGICRVVFAQKDCIADLVPADGVVAGLISSAWDVATLKSKNIPVYNYVSSVEKPITWNKFMNLSKDYMYKYPIKTTLYYPVAIPVKNTLLFWIYITFLHFLPAFIKDAYDYFTGNKPKAVKMYSKLHTYLQLIRPFSTRSFKFYNNNIMNLYEKLNEKDKQLFPFSMKSLDWNKLLENCIIGIKIFLLKEPKETTMDVKQHYQRLSIIHYCVKYIFYFTGFLLLYFMYKTLN